MSASPDAGSVPAGRHSPGGIDGAAIDARPAQCWVEEITTEEALAGLAREWHALSEQGDTALLFNSHEWVWACWRHFHRAEAARDRPRLWVLAVRDAAGLRAVVPLWVETRRFLGLRTRIARFIGEGPSDYGDLLVAPPRRAVIEAVIAHLSARQEDWDLLEMREFFGESPNLRELTELMNARGWWMHQFEDSPCQIIPTDGGWDAYYHRRVSGKQRKGLRREWRNLEEMGAVTKELLTDVDRASGLPDAFAEIQAAHIHTGEHRPGEFNDPVFRPFLEEVLATASARGWLRLAILRRDGVPMAYGMAFLYRGRYYLYNTAHHADCRRYGAGKLLIVYLVEQLFTEGGGVIDYLRGAESYKDTLAERTVINARIRAARPGLRAFTGRMVWFTLMPWLEQRGPLLYRALVVASEKGLAAFAARARRRLVRGS
jgi:CelD/BcsL family acetyltransferase involved in cellulose biosynthesis